MAAITIWHGTDNDLKQLQDAVNHNCTCVDAHGMCPAHRMLTDQTALDHLAFVAYRRKELAQGEYMRRKT